MNPHLTTISTPAKIARCGTLAILACVGLATAACTDDVGTSVRISLVYKDGWNLGSADVVVSKLERNAPIAHELLLLVPDDMAGDVMPLEVWGVRDGERIAHGSAIALPRKGDTVGATIALERLPCGVFCTPGDLRCEMSGLSTCEPDADGCLQWSDPEACPDAMRFCSLGACRVDCVNECASGESTCVDSTHETRCGEYDNDPCLDYSANLECTPGQLCYGGRCAAPCVFTTTLSNVPIGDSPVPFNPSIAIDASGTTHAIYSVLNLRTLRYASRPRGGAWTAWTDIGAVGQAPSLAVDKQRRLHLFFYDAGGTKYGTKALTGGWTFELVKSGVTAGNSSGLVLDAAGSLHAVACDQVGGSVYYSRNVGSGWVNETVAESVVGTDGGSQCDIAVIGSIPHLSFYSSTNNIVHAERTGENQWTREFAARPDTTVVPAYAKTSIAIDRSGTVHIAYTDTFTYAFVDYNDLAITSKVGTSWAAVSIDEATTTSTDTGAVPDLAIDPFDGLHIAYRTVDSPRLRYAYRAGTTWSLGVQPLLTSGLEPSIAIEPTGAVHIVSGDRAAGKSLVETLRGCP
jgi:hypothetical protein